MFNRWFILHIPSLIPLDNASLKNFSLSIASPSLKYKKAKTFNVFAFHQCIPRPFVQKSYSEQVSVRCRNPYLATLLLRNLNHISNSII